jgi:hypothetical protein
MFESVALNTGFPGEGLLRGQVGTVVEQLDDDHFLVEFADLNGVAYAIEPIPASALIELHHEPALVA